MGSGRARDASAVGGASPEGQWRSAGTRAGVAFLLEQELKETQQQLATARLGKDETVNMLDPALMEALGNDAEGVIARLNMVEAELERKDWEIVATHLDGVCRAVSERLPFEVELEELQEEQKVSPQMTMTQEQYRAQEAALRREAGLPVGAEVASEAKSQQEEGTPASAVTPPKAPAPAAVPSKTAAVAGIVPPTRATTPKSDVELGRGRTNLHQQAEARTRPGTPVRVRPEATGTVGELSLIHI